MLRSVVTCKECMICHYWYFNHVFKFQNFLCNGYHDLAMLCLVISNVNIVKVNGIGYRCIIYDISKSEAIYLLGNSVHEKHGVFEDQGYI